MTNINDIADLAQVLQDNPQWRDIIRGILLGDELLEIPKRVAALVSVTEMVIQRLERLESNVEGLKEGQDRLEAGQARLESDVEGLKEGQARLESGQANLSSRLGNIIGSDYERRAAQSARRLVRLGLEVRRARVILAKTAPDRNETPELLNEATENGTVSDDEADDLLLADIILIGELMGESASVRRLRDRCHPLRPRRAPGQEARRNPAKGIRHNRHPRCHRPVRSPGNSGPGKSGERRLPPAPGRRRPGIDPTPASARSVLQC